MRKVVLFMMVSLDGYFEGRDHDISWHHVDAEFNEFAMQQLNEIDLLLFGRKTYELMATYWPTESAKRDDPLVSEKMNTIPKIVFSKTLKKADWENTLLIKDTVAEEVTKRKQQSGKDIAIFGSSDLCVSLLQMGLLDELRIMINPVVIGDGKHVLQGIQNRLNLKLIKSKNFNNGNMLLYYQPLK